MCKTIKIYPYFVQSFVAIVLEIHAQNRAIHSNSFQIL